MCFFSVERGEARKVESARRHGLGERAQGADFRRREAAAAQLLLGRSGDPNGFERREARLEPA